MNSSGTHPIHYVGNATAIHRPTRKINGNAQDTIWFQSVNLVLGARRPINLILFLPYLLLVVTARVGSFTITRSSHEANRTYSRR